MKWPTRKLLPTSFPGSLIFRLGGKMRDPGNEVELLLLWTPYTNELNVFQLIIICQLLYFPTTYTYVNILYSVDKELNSIQLNSIACE